MKIFFANNICCKLADPQSISLFQTKEALLSFYDVQEATHPDSADAIIIQEINSFKDFRYIRKLLDDPFISKYLSKIVTINNDDCATGLLRGLYTSIPAF